MLFWNLLNMFIVINNCYRYGNYRNDYRVTVITVNYMLIYELVINLVDLLVIHLLNLVISLIILLLVV